MLDYFIRRKNHFDKNHRRFVKPKGYGMDRFSLEPRFIDEKKQAKVERTYNLKYNKEEEAESRKMDKKVAHSNKIVLMIAMFLMFLVWLILR